MKRCLSCDVRYSSLIQNCPSCGFAPALVAGFDSYSPNFAHEGGGFKSNYFSELASLEDTNFWFRSRNKLLMWALEKYFPNFQSLLEIGCGTGYVLSGISKKFHLDWKAQAFNQSGWVPAKTTVINGVFQGVLLSQNAQRVRLEFKPYAR